MISYIIVLIMKEKAVNYMCQSILSHKQWKIQLKLALKNPKIFIVGVATRPSLTRTWSDWLRYSWHFHPFCVVFLLVLSQEGCSSTKPHIRTQLHTWTVFSAFLLRQGNFLFTLSSKLPLMPHQPNHLVNNLQPKECLWAGWVRSGF